MEAVDLWVGLTFGVLITGLMIYYLVDFYKRKRK